MKLLHLIHTPRHSGAEVLVRDLCLEHIRQGATCAIAAFGPSSAEFQSELDELRSTDVSIYIPSKPLSGFGRISAFERAIAQFRPDVIFGHSTLPSLYGRASLLMSRSHTPFVSVLHSATDDYADSKLRFAELLMGHRTDRIISVSRSAADRFARHIRWHAPMEIVLNGVNVDRFTGAAGRRNEIRASLGLQDQKVVLQIGRISPVKQQLLTFEALAPLLDESPEAQLWFAGVVEDTAYQAELLSRIDASPHRDRIHFLGPRNDVADLLSAADVYVMPSKSEAHSIAFLEAIVSGVPVVASNIESFSFAARVPGIELIDPSDQHTFCAAVRSYFDQGRFRRDLADSLSLCATASAYLRIAEALTLKKI